MTRIELCLGFNKSSTEQWFMRGGVICREENGELGGQREVAAERSGKCQW